MLHVPVDALLAVMCLLAVSLTACEQASHGQRAPRVQRVGRGIAVEGSWAREPETMVLPRYAACSCVFVVLHTHTLSLSLTHIGDRLLLTLRYGIQARTGAEIAWVEGK